MAIQLCRFWPAIIESLNLGRPGRFLLRESQDCAQNEQCREKSAAHRRPLCDRGNHLQNCSMPRYDLASVEDLKSTSARPAQSPGDQKRSPERFYVETALQDMKFHPHLWPARKSD